MSHSKIDIAFIRWSWMRAILHQGWWLVTSLYLVTIGHLTPSQLIYIGVAQGIVSLLFEIPAGVIADTFSRKWSLVLSQVLMGIAMLLTGLATSFPHLVATQMLWGISWSFASGADVALVTDELNEPLRIASVLTKTARAQLSGAALGIIALGSFAWATTLSTAMISAGILMMLLGLYIVFQFHEKRFVPIREQHWSASWELFKKGLSLVKKSRAILVIFMATFLVNGASDAARLFPKQLVTIGFPDSITPIAWLTGLGIVTLLAGIPALKILEARAHEANIARRNYVFACTIGAAGLLLLAFAPNVIMGSVGILLVSGIAMPITRTMASIQVNNISTDNVRATVHSFLAQAEYLGEIVCGLAIGLLAHATNLPYALAGAAALLITTAILMMR
ncbi:MAG: MFS transporter [Gammaproteobacteria bacterium RIFCSPHIGHO2_12_FULL_38_14]|nr:MAG: MFS transporter [Gammaproteobacteria bacterium RIFCSPHIGHO2_12_FULL_38_14]